MAFALYVAAAVGFSGSNIFYDSLINAVASIKNQTRFLFWAIPWDILAAVYYLPSMYGWF